MTTKSLGLIAGSAVALTAFSGALADNINSDEVRAIVSEMMADAQHRSSNLAGGADAGHDGKFYIADGSGNFRLNVGGQLQFRYIANFSDDGSPTGDDFESGFQTRRTKLWFGGDVFGEFFYKVKGEFSRATGAFGLEDAYVGYNIDENMEVQWGQFKAPFMREELVSSTMQLAADRSLTNEIFNQDYSQGVQFAYNNEDWRAFGMFSDGFGTRNTEFTAAGESDYALTARGEWKAAGTWKQFDDFSGAQSQDYGALVGGAVHWEEDDDASFELFTYTVDVSAEGDGWNAFAAAVGRSIDLGAAGDFDDFGFVAQGGMFIPDTDWEIFGRYDVSFPDDNRTPDGEVNAITVGVNNYIHGHAAKFTFDVQWYLDEVSSLSAGNTGIGYLGDNDEDELVLRAQFQLLF